MRHIYLATLLYAAVALGGCATLLGPPPGAELVGRNARLVPARGEASTLYFGRDGLVRASFSGRSTSGRWWIGRGRLCFLWGGNFQECWPYRRPLRPGETVSLRSDRGNAVRVTLL